jgi:hypothetical protein
LQCGCEGGVISEGDHVRIKIAFIKGSRLLLANCRNVLGCPGPRNRNDTEQRSKATR